MFFLGCQEFKTEKRCRFSSAINSIPLVFPQVLVPSLQYSHNNYTNSCRFPTDSAGFPRSPSPCRSPVYMRGHWAA